MTFTKVISGRLQSLVYLSDHGWNLAFVLSSILLICDGQFLTPDQLREQHDLGYAARTHYEMSGSRRTDMFNRVNPDYLLDG
jgi:hypothetical protein